MIKDITLLARNIINTEIINYKKKMKQQYELMTEEDDKNVLSG